MPNTISDLENTQWVVIIIQFKFYMSEPGDGAEDSLWGREPKRPEGQIVNQFRPDERTWNRATEKVMEKMDPERLTRNQVSRGIMCLLAH